MMRIISIALALLLILNPLCQAVDFSLPVCAYDANHDGFIDESEYANCKQYFSCPDPSVPCINGKCTVREDPICPDSSHLNPELDVCEVDPQVTCPYGYQWDRALDLCIRLPVCPSGAAFVAHRDRCEITPVDRCPPGYNLSGQVCTKPVECTDGGTYVPSRDRCETNFTPYCPSGWQYNRARNQCERAPYCPPPSTYSTSVDMCAVHVNPRCDPPYTYNPSRNRCESDPICFAGTWNRALRRCETFASSYWRCSVNGQRYQSYQACSRNCMVQGSCVSTTVPQVTKTTECRYNDSNFVIFGHIPGWGVPDGYTFYWSGSAIAVLYPGSSVTAGNCTYYAGSFQDYYSSGVVYYIYYSICRTCTTTTYATRYRCQLTGALFSSLWSCQQNCRSRGTCSKQHSCPSGYIYNGSRCVSSSPVCPAGGSYDASTGLCWVRYRVSCPPGYSYLPRLRMCVRYPDCSPGTLNPWLNLCTMYVSVSCPSGYTYDSRLRVCYSRPICRNGVYDPQLNLCRTQIIKDCPGSFSYDLRNDVCYAPPQCPDGTYSQKLNICTHSPEHNCPEGLSYAQEHRMCEAPPFCEHGFYNVDSNMCELVADCKGKWSCPISPSIGCRTLITSDSVQAAYQLDTHEADLSFYDNDGTVNADGCNGNVYIFNGRPMECLTSGIVTGFHNCCSGGCDGRIQNYIDGEMTSFGTLIDGTMMYKAVLLAAGTYRAYKIIKDGGQVSWQNGRLIYNGISIGGGFNPQGVTDIGQFIKSSLINVGIKGYLAGLAADFATDLAFKAFFGGCTAQDELTRCFVKNGLCHYVGSYCKKSWPGVGCVQRAKVYCCFNSKLARIVHEQGRPQLKNFAGSRKNMWGDPEDSPKCRGFTPQEFQMLDFSRIDLSEWYADINAKAKETIQNRLNRNVTNFINKMEK